MMKIVQIIFTLIFVQFCFEASGQIPSNPIIDDFGTIWDLKETLKPDPNLEYKIVIDLKSKITNPSEINPGLNNVARMLNLHGTGGIPNDKLLITVAVHGLATPSILNNAGYEKKFGVKNPNLKLIDQLVDSGVNIYVCGQSMVARGYSFDNVNENVKPALSMLTVVTEKMMNGYGLLVFN